MSAPPAWTGRFVGVPYLDHGQDPESGLDCWSLARLVWREVYGIEVPSYAADYTAPLDHAEVAALITGELPRDWVAVGQDDVQPGDAVLLRVSGRPLHVGVIVGAPWFLHVMAGRNTCLERLDGPQWERRVLGYYRHASRADRVA